MFFLGNNGQGGQAPYEAGHYGIAQLSTTTQATNTAAIGISRAGYTNQATIIHETMIRIPTLSDGTNRFSVRSGFWNSIAGDGTIGIGIRYVDNVNSGKWVIVTRQSSIETVTNTNLTVSTSQWYKLRIEINSDATEVKFYINDVLEATHTTNIPQNSEVNALANIVKSSGTTARTINIDYAYLHLNLNSARTF